MGKDLWSTKGYKAYEILPVFILESQQVGYSHSESGEHKLDNIQIIADIIWCLGQEFEQFIVDYTISVSNCNSFASFNQMWLYWLYITSIHPIEHSELAELNSTVHTQGFHPNFTWTAPGP